MTERDFLDWLETVLPRSSPMLQVKTALRKSPNTRAVCLRAVESERLGEMLKVVASRCVSEEREEAFHGF